MRQTVADYEAKHGNIFRATCLFAITLSQFFLFSWLVLLYISTPFQAVDNVIQHKEYNGVYVA